MEKTANQAGNNLNEINTRHDYVFHLYAITNTKKDQPAITELILPKTKTTMV